MILYYNKPYIPVRLHYPSLPSPTLSHPRSVCPVSRHTRWTHWKCNCPMSAASARVVRRSVCGSKFLKKGGKLHFHAPIGALIFYYFMF